MAASPEPSIEMGPATPIRSGGTSARSMHDPVSARIRQDADIHVITRTISESWFPGERRPNLDSFDPRGTSRPTIGMLTRHRAGSLVKRAGEATTATIAEEAPRDKFGMWDGVVARCLLNIWGVIMYLRTGWVTGTAGVALAFAIILLCTMVTTLTTLSLSAICTNGEVSGGGPYFLISRALGPEYGGAVGIMFYIANTIVLAIYVIGFSEGMVDVISGKDNFILGSFVNDVRLIGCITMVFMLVMAFVGIKAIVRFQLALLVVLVASIITFFVATFAYSSDEKIGFTGYSMDTLSENFGPDFGDESFFTVFAIFFPAVTGIVAGANISGDLKNPGSSIPRGTLYAIGGSTVVYLLLVLAFGATLTRFAPDGGLKGDFLIMIHVAKDGAGVLYGGLYAATLSSAIASMVGAPRVLMAFARDNIVNFLKPFAVSWGKNEEPLRAYALTFIIALPLVLAADINFVSPFVTNFFLSSYALINYACFAQTFSKAPGWRPTFTYSNVYTSGLGCALCVVVMFLIDIKNNCVLALATCFIGFLLYKYVEKKKPPVNWGDASAARSYVRAHKALWALSSQHDHVKNFRPQYLVLTGDMAKRRHLVSLTGLLRKGKGVSVFGRILPGTLVPISEDQAAPTPDRIAKLASITPYLAEGDEKSDDGDDAGEGVGRGEGESEAASTSAGRGRTVGPDQFLAAVLKNERMLKSMAHGPMKIMGFNKVFCAEDFTTGVLSMLELVGLGKLQPNTLVLGYQAPEAKRRPGDEPEVDQEDYVNVIRASMNFGFNVMVAKNLERFDFTKRQTGNIDIWWLSDDGGLTLLLAHLLSRHPLWNKCKLRAMVLSDSDTMDDKIARTKQLLAKLRFPVQVVPVQTTRKLPSTQSLETFNQLSIGPKTFSAGKFTARRGLRDIFSLNNATAAPTQGGKTEDPAAAAARKEQQVEDTINQRLVLLGEYIGSISGDACMTIASLPVPGSHQRAEQYMARLGMMTEGVGPMLLVRGNQESVLTFSS